MLVEISNGEIVDKYSILCIKLDWIDEAMKLHNVKVELESIIPHFNSIMKHNNGMEAIFNDLHDINIALWNVLQEQHEEIESNDRDSARLIEIMFEIYHLNNERFEAKTMINRCTCSRMVEEKHYDEA